MENYGLVKLDLAFCAEVTQTLGHTLRGNPTLKSVRMILVNKNLGFVTFK